MRGLTEVFEALTTEYAKWCKRQDIQYWFWSADELLHASYCDPAEGGYPLTEKQREWLIDFIKRWDQASEDEREFFNETAHSYDCGCTWCHSNRLAC